MPGFIVPGSTKNQETTYRFAYCRALRLMTTTIGSTAAVSL